MELNDNSGCSVINVGIQDKVTSTRFLNLVDASCSCLEKLGKHLKC